jgi:hypothetical protein
VGGPWEGRRCERKDIVSGNRKSVQHELASADVITRITISQKAFPSGKRKIKKDNQEQDIRNRRQKKKSFVIPHTQTSLSVAQLHFFYILIREPYLLQLSS